MALAPDTKRSYCRTVSKRQRNAPFTRRNVEQTRSLRSRHGPRGRQQGLGNRAHLDLPRECARLRGARKIWRRSGWGTHSNPIQRPGGQRRLGAWGVRVACSPRRPLRIRPKFPTSCAMPPLLASRSAGSPRDAVMAKRGGSRSGRGRRQPTRRVNPPPRAPLRWWNRITKTILGAGALATAIAAVLALVLPHLPSHSQENVARFISVQALSPVTLSQYVQRSARPPTQSADRPQNQGPMLAVAVIGRTSPSSGPDGTTSTAPPSGPATAPSSGPATAPSSGPATAPSSGPATAPSSGPATAPSSGPATAPSSGPATAPSSAPATAPSSAPATAPSSAPATAPSSAPATAPSSAPANDAQPGQLPPG